MADKTYARIADGAVAELVTLDDSINIVDVFHADLVWVDVTGLNPMPQQRWLYDGTNFAAPPPPVLTPQQIYSQAIFSGCQIRSNNSQVSGTYPIDDSSLAKVTAVAAGLTAGRGLPGGGPTFNLLDIYGSPHSMNSADFMNLASALENYVYALISTEMAIMGGHAATWPTQPVSIP